MFQASEQLEKLCSTPWKVWHSQLGGAIQSEELTVEQKGSTLWKNAVGFYGFQLCMHTTGQALLQ